MSLSYMYVLIGLMMGGVLDVVVDAQFGYRAPVFHSPGLLDGPLSLVSHLLGGGDPVRPSQHRHHIIRPPITYHPVVSMSDVQDRPTLIRRPVVTIPEVQEISPIIQRPVVTFPEMQEMPSMIHHPSVASLETYERPQSHPPGTSHHEGCQSEKNDDYYSPRPTRRPTHPIRHPKPTRRPIHNWSQDDLDTSAALYQGCGAKFKTRIVGGIQSQKQDWSWMAALLKPDEMKAPFCGGALISPTYVMTAAHCTQGQNARNIIVRLGEYDFGREDDNSHQDFQVAVIKQHPRFDKKTNQNDISLLRLRGTAVIGDDVTPICLPNPSSWISEKIATVAGWGTMKYGGDTSPVLRQVSIPIWKNPDCYKALNRNITRLFLCAGNKEGGQDSCQGDSGGPLMLEDEQNRWHVVGVVSWGIRCAEPGLPGVYTRVSRYVDWIKENALEN